METTSRFSPTSETFAHVDILLDGRLMCANLQEHDCQVTHMSPGDATLKCKAHVTTGERIVAYLDHIGRIEGEVTAIIDNGFVIGLRASDRKREKLAAQLTWYANKHELGLPEDRRHERVIPRNPVAEIHLDDGRTYPCRIIDLSLSGAAINIDAKFDLGTRVMFGTMRAKIVRHFPGGIAIEFLTVQPIEALRRFL